MEIFLGGTCSKEHDYRPHVKTILKKLGIGGFDPVVKVWDEAARMHEERAKNIYCSHQLYLITPHAQGLYSIAEVVEQAILRQSRNRPFTVIFAVCLSCCEHSFTEDQAKSFKAIIDLLEKYQACTLMERDLPSMLKELALLLERLKKQQERKVEHMMELALIPDK